MVRNNLFMAVIVSRVVTGSNYRQIKVTSGHDIDCCCCVAISSLILAWDAQRLVLSHSVRLTQGPDWDGSPGVMWVWAVPALHQSDVGGKVTWVLVTWLGRAGTVWYSLSHEWLRRHRDNETKQVSKRGFRTYNEERQSDMYESDIR